MTDIVKDFFMRLAWASESINKTIICGLNKCSECPLEEFCETRDKEYNATIEPRR